MYRRVTGLLITFFLIALTAAANDPWTDKDSKDWDLKDVQKILTDSPWSKTIQTGSVIAGSSSGEGPQAVTGTPPPMTDRAGSMARPDANAVGGDQPLPNAPSQKFIVSWFSSRTVREAAARKRELQGVSSDVARKDLAMEFETFQIAVVGPDLTAFAKDGSEVLKTNSYLLPKKANEKLAPTNVFLQMGPDGFRPILILYEFSRKTATGEPTIGFGEKGVDFDAQAGKLRLKVTFDISKMSGKKGMDL